LCRHIIAGQLNSIYENHKEKGSTGIGTISSGSIGVSKIYHSAKSNPHTNTKKISLLEMKKQKYSSFPFLKQLELQLLNIIKKERLNDFNN